MDHKEKAILNRLLREAEDNAREISKVLHFVREILRELKPKPLTAAIAVRFTGDNSMDNALVLNVGQTSTANIMPLLADGVTSSNGVVSAVTYTFNDPSATVVINADGLTATVTGVAASTGSVSGSAACTVTDTDGVVSTWTQAFTIQTNGAVPPAQLTQSVAVQFSTPTP
jgi:hypothetical protein